MLLNSEKFVKDTQVFELFGDYYHKDDPINDIIAWHKEAGYDCEIVWESDLAQWLSEHGCADINPNWSRKQLRSFLRSKFGQKEVKIDQ